MSAKDYKRVTTTGVVNNIHLEADGSATVFLPPGPMPRPAGQGCTCAMLPTATGEMHSVNWLTMQSHVEVVMTSGEVFAGEPHSTRFTLPTGEYGEWHLWLMYPREDDDVYLPLAEINTVTPLPAATVQTVMGEVAALLNAPASLAVKDERTLTLPVGPEGDHERMSVTVMRQEPKHECVQQRPSTAAAGRQS